MAVERGQRVFLQPIDEYVGDGIWMDIENGEMTVTYTDGRTESHKVQNIQITPKKMAIHIDKDGKMTAYGSVET